MSGFRAFEAQVLIEWSQSLYITLVRGLPGTRKLHRRTLEAMGLRRCHRTVLHSNTSSIRGMIQQFKRMVVVLLLKQRRCTKLAKKQKPTTKLSARHLLCQSFKPCHCNWFIQHVLSISQDVMRWLFDVVPELKWNPENGGIEI